MDWKSHPVIVALTSGAVTLAFCITTVLPVWTKVLENRVDEYRKEVVSLKESIKVSDERSLYFEKRNKALLWDGSISKDAPYPKGFNGVVIGDPVSKVDYVYKGAKIEKKKGWVSVDLLGKSEAISVVAYYFDEAQKVNHILYFFRADESSPLKDVDGRVGPSGEAVLSSLRNNYPGSELKCDDDEVRITCSMRASKYKFKVTSLTYHVDI
ncbi:hypothetical protein [Pseudomonas protegens]|uniref:hypothetical protein n=1 Tax=Pseudomonas protegens TaxID=380021 RepID=UPI001F2098D6|nr:hypothetical protein [Pseudomonas protegens]